jgi:hypothetical protein
VNVLKCEVWRSHHKEFTRAGNKKRAHKMKQQMPQASRTPAADPTIPDGLRRHNLHSMTEAAKRAGAAGRGRLVK